MRSSEMWRKHTNTTEIDWSQLVRFGCNGGVGQKADPTKLKTKTKNKIFNFDKLLLREMSVEKKYNKSNM